MSAAIWIGRADSSWSLQMAALPISQDGAITPDGDADTVDGLDLPTKQYEDEISWDENPADLNKWLANEMPAWETRGEKADV
jgi:hypothetical protein